MATFTAGQVLTAAEMNQIGNDTGWTAVIGGIGYQNSWVTYTSAALFRLIGNRVYLRGGVQSGTSGTPCFTLPVGFRPSSNGNFSCANGNSPFGSTYVAITTVGAVTVFSNTYGVYLDSISILID